MSFRALSGFCIALLAGFFVYDQKISLKQISRSKTHKLKYRVFNGRFREQAKTNCFVFHGAGADEKDLYGLLKTVDAPNRYINFRGPFNFGTGFVWHWAEAPTQEEAIKLAHQIEKEVTFALFEAVFEIKQKYQSLDEQFCLIGYSAGARQAFRLALTQPESFSKVILLAGDYSLKQETEWLSWIQNAKNSSNLQFTIVHGNSDPVFSFVQANEMCNELMAKGLKCRFISYEGGHQFPINILKDNSVL